jgi:hypothetical protein
VAKCIYIDVLRDRESYPEGDKRAKYRANAAGGAARQEDFTSTEKLFGGEKIPMLLLRIPQRI